RGSVAHVDLYRVNSSDELVEMGFTDLGTDVIGLVEWPDRAADLLPEDRIDLEFRLGPERPEVQRLVRIRGFGALAGRLHRLRDRGHFREDSGLGDAPRLRVQGDASTRAYERLQMLDRPAILMNAPRQSDGPPVRNGLPYSRLVHLAEDVTPFVAMARGLRER